jgi:hypothetical protein
MGDPELAALVRHATRRFPRGLDGEEIQGIDLDLLDDVFMGVASHYDRNSRPVTAEHHAMILQAIEDLDRLWPDLPTDEAREYFAARRDIAAYLLGPRAEKSRPTRAQPPE